MDIFLIIMFLFCGFALMFLYEYECDLKERAKYKNAEKLTKWYYVLGFILFLLFWGMLLV